MKFACLKATKGGDFRDPSFATNWAQAVSAGIPVGAHHFFTQCKSAKHQAGNFLATVPPLENPLPSVIDAEHRGPCAKGTPQFDPATEIAVFLDVVQAQAGCCPIIYGRPEFNSAYLSQSFRNERFWVRSSFVTPYLRKAEWVFWQYHKSGRRSGVTGPVDLNVFRGTPETFAYFIKTANCFAAKP